MRRALAVSLLLGSLWACDPQVVIGNVSDGGSGGGMAQGNGGGTAATGGGAAVVCSNATCSGCCAANGACRRGDAVDACGAEGFACSTCQSGQICALGHCASGSNSGGGSGGGNGGAGGGGSSEAPKMRVFITSSTFNGNLGGLAGADQKCMLAASAGNKGGTWKAYLSSSTESALSRMAEVGPWYQEANDGTYLQTFNNKANLTTYPLNELYVDEQGAGAVVNDVRYAQWFWSATFLDGTIGPAHCRDWTSTASSDEGMRPLCQ